MLTIICSLMLTLTTQAVQPNRLEPLRFLVGEWEAVETGDGATGRSTFRYHVQTRVMLRNNFSDSPRGHHEDFMVIYQERNELRADYYDMEDHVIRYKGESRVAGEVAFVSLPSRKAPQYRLTYSLSNPDELTGKFEIAQPGKPFAVYLNWKMKRKKL